MDLMFLLIVGGGLTVALALYIIKPIERLKGQSCYVFHRLGNEVKLYKAWLKGSNVTCKHGIFDISKFTTPLFFRRKLEVDTLRYETIKAFEKPKLFRKTPNPLLQPTIEAN